MHSWSSTRATRSNADVHKSRLSELRLKGAILVFWDYGLRSLRLCSAACVLSCSAPSSEYLPCAFFS